MKTPNLKTERLILRPLTVNDAEEVFTNWTSDPDVAKFMRWTVHKDVSETSQWLASDETLLESIEVYNWGFILKETGELIGSGGLVFNEAKGMYELGYNIMKKYWGNGFATEASQKIIDFGKMQLKQTRFYCCHAKNNPASGRVMTKIGFRYQNDVTYTSWDQERTFDAREFLLIVE